jgi:ketosteroid isomerase-like protein
MFARNVTEGKRMTGVIERWHAMVRAKDTAALDDLLDDDAVFLSPVVHAPQEGKMKTAMYLHAAMHVLNNDSFHYRGEWHAPNSAILEFELVLDGITINGVDMIWWNDAGRITRFKVMVRPLKAINLLHQKMGEMLAAFAAGPRAA